jgi:hypothetical protein
VHLGPIDADLAERWAASGLSVGLDAVPHDRRPGAWVARYVAETADPDQQVTVIMPAPADESWREWIRRLRRWSGVAAALRSLPNVGVVVVRDHGGAGHHLVDGRLRVVPRRRHVALILVEGMDRAVVKAARYARGLDAMDVRGVHAANDPDRAEHLIGDWLAAGYLTGMPLDVEECHDRNIERSLRRYVARFQDLGTEVSLIVPRRHFAKRRHLLLHDRTSRRIARAFRHQPHVNVVMVPYALHEPRDEADREAEVRVEREGASATR